MPQKLKPPPPFDPSSATTEEKTIYSIAFGFSLLAVSIRQRSTTGEVGTTQVVRRDILLEARALASMIVYEVKSLVPPRQSETSKVAVAQGERE